MTLNTQIMDIKPATEWNEAYPIGNGRLGGMVFGTVPVELIQLNEDSVWYGKPCDRNNPDARTHLPRIRKLLFAGKIKEAEKLARLALSGTPESQRPYQTLGELFIEEEHPDKEILDYKRCLDLRSAAVTVTFRRNNIHYKRTYFSSAIHQVIVIRLEADKKRGVSFTACLRRGRYLDDVKSISPDIITLSGNCGRGGIRFCMMVKAVPEGGNISTIGESLLVENADSVTLLLSAETTFYRKNHQVYCLNHIKRMSSVPYEKLLQDHNKDYRSLYDRMSVELKGEKQDPGIENLSTPQRLERIRQGKDDPGLLSLYFQYGRYLLISCSRPGTLPANLQGIWNKDMLPPWDSKYTININTEMNYWPAEVCNLSECHTPLFDLLKRMLKQGRKTAKVMYGCHGFVAHHNTDIWADTAPQDIWVPATFWPMGAAWLCLHLWEHYEYTQDSTFLKKVYPIMKEAALFLLDFLIEDSKGRLVTCPSVSPENVYKLKNGETGSLCIGPSMDSQIIHALFKSCIRAGQILKKDRNFSLSLAHALERLPSLETGKYGQIREWAEDYDEVEPGHRHISHLFALHPGNQITVRGTPELAGAARKTLERRLAHGGGHTGWSRAWIVNLWARLEDPDKAYENVMELLKNSTLPNLLDNHPPFQIDGNFGGTAGIAEMLLQTHNGEINCLPALPDKWVHGHVKGIRARGGMELDIYWENGKLKTVMLRPLKGGEFVIRYKNKTNTIKLVKGEKVTLDGTLVSIM